MYEEITFFLIVCLLGGLGSISAEGSSGAIYAWVDGSSTCYQFSAMPRVRYEGKKALLELNGVEQLRLDLSEGSLKITYGVYVPGSSTDVEQTQEPIRQQGKFIHGGRLIILHNGHAYDVQGRLLHTAL